MVEKKFTIVGNPVLHSVSPGLFKSAYAAYPQFTYSASLVESANEAVNKFKSEFLGGNVTAPFKESILEHVNEVTNAVKFIEACNQITRTAKGELLADNTDYIGVMGSLKEHNVDIKNTKCLLLGIGGAGKAAAYALNKLGANTTIVNRTEAKAKEYADKLNVEYSSINNLKELLKTHTVIINTLYPEIDIIKAEWLNSEHTILDASYVKSALVEKAKGTKCKCIDGRYWVYHQAIPAFKTFTAIGPNTEQMRKFIGI